MTKVIVREVGLRDGLQLVKSFVPTETKIKWLKAVAAAGVPEVEVTNFVPAKVIPQFADAAEVAKASLDVPGPRMCALAPNRKGAENMLAAGIRKINFVLSVSEGHNLANVRKTPDQSFAEFESVVALRKEKPEYKEVVIQGCLATSFGCTIEGSVDPKRVVSFAERYLALGADEITLADTVGYAGPGAVKSLFDEVVKLAAGKPVYCHFHDTRGLGLANAYAALEAGVTGFDASTGGLGGCPFAPGASGNIVMEDLVFMLEKQGIRTGVDLELYREARRIAETALPDESFYGTIFRAGLPKGFNPPTRRMAAE
ncbi:hydroxymethylglutaryl-CoA lyase [Hyphomicrobium sp. CS1BSMeth3]|uniref:hydroxymethylglutaryl-CoA lyase n=1 Tax=Hyphomicrobium sp. CS1BSMeth3 TaxID=1892844 RepID=UPI000930D78F|nr:hydroxymethylglutaryl-CoA lyase [Hyphomicrobium sp. CS1BSMeth3]